MARVRPVRELPPARRSRAGPRDRGDRPLVRHAAADDLPEPDARACSPARRSGWARSPSAPSWAGAVGVDPAGVALRAARRVWPRRSITANCAARSSRSATTRAGRSARSRWSTRPCFTVGPVRRALRVAARLRRGRSPRRRRRPAARLRPHRPRALARRGGGRRRRRRPGLGGPVAQGQHSWSSVASSADRSRQERAPTRRPRCAVGRLTRRTGSRSARRR